MSNLARSHAEFAFPPRNDQVRADWMPIYIEPMVSSGERIAIGVVVASRESFIVVPVASLNRLKCVYGADVESLLFAANIALESIKTVMAKEGAKALESWTSPFEGIHRGDIRLGVGNSLEQIARSALSLCSSLVHNISESDSEVDNDVESRSALTDSRLESLIKNKVINGRPLLEVHFGRDFQPNVNARSTKIGYVGRNIAANFCLLVPSSLSKQVKDAKAKLWDLDQVKEYTKTGSFGLTQQLNRFELLVHKIHVEDPLYTEKQIGLVTEAINELEAEADKKDIRCRPLHTPEEMAKVIIDAEAA